MACGEGSGVVTAVAQVLSLAQELLRVGPGRKKIQFYTHSGLEVKGSAYVACELTLQNAHLVHEKLNVPYSWDHLK